MALSRRATVLTISLQLLQIPFTTCHNPTQHVTFLRNISTRTRNHLHVLRGGGGGTSVATPSPLQKRDKIAVLSGLPPPPPPAAAVATTVTRTKKTRPKKSAPPPVERQRRHPLSDACVPTTVWSSLTGSEFTDDESTVVPLLRSLTRTALRLCDLVPPRDGPLTTWKADSKTESLLGECCGGGGGGGGGSTEDDLREAFSVGSLPSDAVLIWTTKFSEGAGCYGGSLPLVRSRGLIYGMSPRDVAALLMDSERVKTYNKMSLGRDDITIVQEGIDTVDGRYGDGETKIVRNLTKPPLVKSLMEFRTMMHARKLNPEVEGGTGYVVVSRAVVGGDDEDDDGSGRDETIKRSEILMGVNLLRTVRGREDVTEMTSVTHVQSPFVHPLVAGKVGVKGAVNFFNDVRGVGK